jgi:hypothetical protein
MEVGDNLLVSISVALSSIKRTLFCSIYDMKTQGIIKDISHATLIFQAKSDPMPQEKEQPHQSSYLNLPSL